MKSVQNLIERCLNQYMTQAEVIATLQVQADVDPALTCLVWSKLEEANPDFFLSYDVRLKLKDQVVAFNYLVEQQTRHHGSVIRSGRKRRRRRRDELGC